MKKINVEATKLNNEDVIATSGAACFGKYHIRVVAVNADDDKEFCYLFKDDGTGSFGERIETKPADLSSAPGSMPDNHYRIDLGVSATGGMFYWDGSSWVECDENHPR